MDVGCGTGRLTGLLAEQVTHVIGVEPGEDQLAHATPADGISCVHATAGARPWPTAAQSS
ncbi:class I SAM-dependent methyltransferase [Kocuria rhizophila]|uniref:class I SAM-dependent methyltransferase n=1 Tax=Kocuria rhizophila TaxID=72000 RepID=UPI0035B5F55B